jgi:hypothetical protein
MAVFTPSSKESYLNSTSRAHKNTLSALSFPSSTRPIQLMFISMDMWQYIYFTGVNDLHAMVYQHGPEFDVGGKTYLVLRLAEWIPTVGPPSKSVRIHLPISF